MSSRLIARTLFAALALGASATLGCNANSPTGPSVPATETFAPELNVNIATMTKLYDDLYIEDLVAGSGPTVATGDSVFVHYTGYLANGSKFDTSIGKSPLSFRIGSRSVITGWELGFPGMKVGGKRKLVIGSSFAYGATGRGQIPRHATLVFDVELTAVK